MSPANNATMIQCMNTLGKYCLPKNIPMTLSFMASTLDDDAYMYMNVISIASFPYMNTKHEINSCKSILLYDLVHRNKILTMKNRKIQASVALETIQNRGNPKTQGN